MGETGCCSDLSAANANIPKSGTPPNLVSLQSPLRQRYNHKIPEEISLPQNVFYPCCCPFLGLHQSSMERHSLRLMDRVD